MSKNEQDNLKKYQERLKEILQTPISKNNPTIDDLAKEGEMLLYAQEKKSGKPPKQSELKKIPVVNGNNPYYQAREKILASYPEWKRTEMLLLEKNDKTEGNRHYAEFCRLVTDLGDFLSSK